jgi:hypothetical protein
LHSRVELRNYQQKECEEKKWFVGQGSANNQGEIKGKKVINLLVRTYTQQHETQHLYQHDLLVWVSGFAQGIEDKVHVICTDNPFSILHSEKLNSQQSIYKRVLPATPNNSADYVLAQALILLFNLIMGAHFPALFFLNDG